MQGISPEEAVAILKLQATLYSELSTVSEINQSLTARLQEYEPQEDQGPQTTPTKEGLNGSGSQSSHQAKPEEVQGRPEGE